MQTSINRLCVNKVLAPLLDVYSTIYISNSNELISEYTHAYSILQITIAIYFTPNRICWSCCYDAAEAVYKIGTRC